MDLKEKLKNFPKIYYPSLGESIDRRRFMQSQCERLGLDGIPFVVDRYETISDRINWTGRPGMPTASLPSIISYLRMFKQWYDNTNQDYAVFCEDDINFEALSYWNFSWDEFIATFPENWDAIQIIRVEDKLYHHVDPSILDFKVKTGRWWCASGIFRRKYVKRLLDHYASGDVYNISVPHPEFYEEGIENVLYLMPNSSVYNFPMVFEEFQTLKSTYNKYHDHGNLEEARKFQTICNIYWKHKWKNEGSNLTLDYIWK